MVLKGKRIILRKFNPKEAKEYLEATNDFAIKRYVPFACPNDLDESFDLLKNYSERDFKNDFFFAIEHIKSRKIVGSLQAFRSSTYLLDTSYFIFSDFRGNEFCKEAILTFINYLSKSTNYKSLVFYIRKNNKSSLKIMEKLSAQKTSEDKKFCYFQYQIKSAK